MNEIWRGVVIGLITALALAALGSLRGEWFIRALGGATASDYDLLRSSLDRAQIRIDGIKLTSIDRSKKEFGCGGSGVAEVNSLTVMYGSRDGTSCKVTNENYFKELVLTVPPN